MVIVGATIFPHGTMTLDRSRTDLPDGATKLHDACVNAAGKIAKMSPTLLLLSTPHGCSLRNHFGIYSNTTAKGNAEWNDNWQNYEVSVNLDQNTSLKLVEDLNNHGVPIEAINIFSNYDCPLRWGECVPLHFLSTIPTKVIILTQPTKADSAERLKAGSVLYDFLTKLDERVVIVISGDLAHTHQTSCTNPLYLPNPRWNLPISPTAEPFDSCIEEWVKSGTKSLLLQTAGNLSTEALSCGYTGFVMLQGILDRMNLNGEVLFRCAPTYFGMIIAVYTTA